MTKIFFDSDGVMANLEIAIAKHVQVHFWDRMNAEQWKVLEKIPNFFYTLDVMQGAIEMFNTVYEAHGNKVEILTAVPNPTGLLHTAAEDKERWFKDFIHNEVTVNTVLGGKNKYKFLEQHPGAILIDDYNRNIEQWIAAGGIGILHTDPHSTIEKLKVLNIL